MSLSRPVRARNLNLKVFTESDVATLETSVQTWLDGREEDSVVDIQFGNNGNANFFAFVLYAE